MQFFNSFWLFGYFLNHLIEVEGEELLDGHILICDGFDDFLRNYSSEISADDGELGLADVAELVCKFQGFLQLLFTEV